MVESIYVHPLKLEGIEKSGANHLIFAEQGLDQEIWQGLKNLKMDLAISLRAFDPGVCPADPNAKKLLFKKIDQALKYGPKEVWLDFFRFGGECTVISEAGVSLAHPACQYCEGKNRQGYLSDFAKEVKSHVNRRSKIGLFAIAFKDDKSPQLALALGLDYPRLGKSFDMISPMIYHRMFGKPPNYISEYVQWISQRSGKSILPIIQIKDMPDDLEDKMTEEDIKEAFDEAIKSPSIGICFFWWVHALEGNKTGIISRLFSNTV